MGGGVWGAGGLGVGAGRGASSGSTAAVVAASVGPGVGASVGLGVGDSVTRAVGAVVKAAVLVLASDEPLRSAEGMMVGATEAVTFALELLLPLLSARVVKSCDGLLLGGVVRPSAPRSVAGEGCEVAGAWVGMEEGSAEEPSASFPSSSFGRGVGAPVVVGVGASVLATTTMAEGCKVKDGAGEGVALDVAVGASDGAAEGDAEGLQDGVAKGCEAEGAIVPVQSNEYENELGVSVVSASARSVSRNALERWMRVCLFVIG